MNDKHITNRNCPHVDCNGKLIRKRNRMTGSYFLGCNKFPRCRYSQSINKKTELNYVPVDMITAFDDQLQSLLK